MSRAFTGSTAGPAAACMRCVRTPIPEAAHRHACVESLASIEAAPLLSIRTRWACALVRSCRGSRQARAWRWDALARAHTHMQRAYTQPPTQTRTHTGTRSPARACAHASTRAHAVAHAHAHAPVNAHTRTRTRRARARARPTKRAPQGKCTWK